MENMAATFKQPVDGATASRQPPDHTYESVVGADHATTLTADENAHLANTKLLMTGGMLENVFTPPLTSGTEQLSVYTLGRDEALARQMTTMARSHREKSLFHARSAYL